MTSKYWQVIRDDAKHTFEICGQESNTNYFTNEIHGMQKAGMNVSAMTPPVGSKLSNRETIKITGYTKEPGLYDRLLKEYSKITRASFDLWED